MKRTSKRVKDSNKSKQTVTNEGPVNGIIFSEDDIKVESNQDDRLEENHDYFMDENADHDDLNSTEANITDKTEM